MLFFGSRLEDKELSAFKESESTKKICIGLKAADLHLISDMDEEKSVSDFVLNAKSSQLGIIDYLNLFCVLLGKLEHYNSPAELVNIYKEVYQLYR